MRNNTKPVKNPAQTYYVWPEDTGFTPPEPAGNAARHKNNPPSPQTGDLVPLLEKLLTNICSAANANGGIIRIFPPHVPRTQLVSSEHFPLELLEAEDSAQTGYATHNSNKTASGFYVAGLRPGQAHNAQSLITLPIASAMPPDVVAGMLTLFFDRPQHAITALSSTARAYAQMLGAVIDHDKACRDARRTDLIAERQSIANEIHDSLAQTLVYARMRTSLLAEAIRTGNHPHVVKYVHDIDEALEHSQKSARELITDFRCAIDPAGLSEALHTLTRQFCQRNQIALEYLNRAANLELPLEYEIQVFHIVQEALANIATHAQATHARLGIALSGNYYVFTIEDNGRGGCPVVPDKGHYGLAIMRERARRIGGEISVESPPGAGTRVRLYFPLP